MIKINTRNLKLSLVISVVLVALIAAFISAKYLFNGSALNAVPWGILAFASAYVASNKRQAVTIGGVFGFIVSYSFLWFDNKSLTLSKVVILIPLIVLPALFGLLCGSLAAWLGWKSRQTFKKA